MPVVSAFPKPAALGDPCIRGVLPDVPLAPVSSAAQLPVVIDSKPAAAIKAVFRMTDSLGVPGSLLTSALYLNVFARRLFTAAPDGLQVTPFNLESRIDPAAGGPSRALPWRYRTVAALLMAS